MYVTLENASEFEVCVVVINGPGIVPQMEMDVTVFATNFNDSSAGTEFSDYVNPSTHMPYQSFFHADLAMAEVDFLPLTSVLTFDSSSSGRLCATVALIVDDNVTENDEIFSVYLQAGGNGNISIPTDGSSAIVTIISDDGKPK